MNDFYQIDEIGKMEYLSNLHCFCSSKEFEVTNYKVSIGINSTDKNECKNHHSYIHLILKELSNFDKIAKTKLNELYNPTQKELQEITINHINFDLNKDFELCYNLPKGSPFEYLSIKFSEERNIIDFGGGNY